MAVEVPYPDEVYEELQMQSAVFIEKIRALLGLPPINSFSVVLMT